MLSVILICCTNIACVILEVELKHVVIHAMSSLKATKRIIIHKMKTIVICKTE